MRKAFTLIELLISIVILSILMLFLYKSYASLNRSNALLSKEVSKLKTTQLLKKTIYMDFTLALKNSVKILKQDKQEDVVYLQTSNSVHKRINPYVAYILKDKKLYRLESLRPFKEYPMGADAEFVSDMVAKAKSFRVYPSTTQRKYLFLVDLVPVNRDEILLNIKALNF